MPEGTHSREVVGGTLWTGEVFGLFFLMGGIMEKELDLLDKNFNLGNLRSVGIEPIKVLGKAMIDATGTADHPIVCTMLYEKITELDAKIAQLIAKK